MNPDLNCILFRLSGPMQAWAPGVAFTRRETAEVPTKRGVIGLLAAALGLPRGVDVSPLSELRMGVRVDRPGVREVDFQTSTGFLRAQAKPPLLTTWDDYVGYQQKCRDDPKDAQTEVIRAEYLADAVFLVGMEGDPYLLHHLNAALRAPVFTLFLGRKSFGPGAPVWLADGLSEAPLADALTEYPWLGPRRTEPRAPAELRLELETDFCDPEGFERLDQPLGALDTFETTSRYVRSMTVPRPEIHQTQVITC